MSPPPPDLLSSSTEDLGLEQTLVFVLVLLPLQPLIIWLLLGESIPESLGLSNFRTLYFAAAAAAAAEDVPGLLGVTAAAAVAEETAAETAAAAAAAMGQPPALMASELACISSTRQRFRFDIVTAEEDDDDDDVNESDEDELGVDVGRLAAAEEEAAKQAAAEAGIVSAFMSTLLFTLRSCVVSLETTSLEQMDSLLDTEPMGLRRLQLLLSSVLVEE